jgi:hypothetical protein
MSPSALGDLVTPAKIQARWRVDRRWATIAEALRRSARLSTEVANEVDTRPGESPNAARVEQALELLGEASRQLRGLLREQAERDRIPPTPDASTWCTCEEAADLLGIPPEAIRALARRRLLWTRKATRVVPSGEARRVTVYDPQQLIRLSRRTIESVEHRTPGE